MAHCSEGDPWGWDVTILQTQRSRTETENKEPLLLVTSFMQAAGWLLKAPTERQEHRGIPPLNLLLEVKPT